MVRRPRYFGRVRPLKKRVEENIESSAEEEEGTSNGTYENGLGKQKETWVKLNVGGKIFQTSSLTLRREPESFFQRLCPDKGEPAVPSKKDCNGAILIDRDPEYFAPILNYLRHGKLVINQGIAEEGVLEEAEFYNLPILSQMCQDRIAERNTKANATTKHVYRVLQCHSEELTGVVSAMSDDWRLEQLIPIPVPSYSDNQGEYLCVVSRECQNLQNGTVPESQDRAKLLQQKARHN